MKKRNLPLTFVFAFALGLTTHSALCMKSEEEERGRRKCRAAGLLTHLEGLSANLIDPPPRPRTTPPFWG